MYKDKYVFSKTTKQPRLIKDVKNKSGPGTHREYACTHGLVPKGARSCTKSQVKKIMKKRQIKK